MSDQLPILTLSPRSFSVVEQSKLISFHWVGNFHSVFQLSPSPQYLSTGGQIPIQITSVTQLCPTLCDPMNRSTPGLPVHHQLLEFTQTHVHQVSDAIQPSHPLCRPLLLLPPIPPSIRVNSSHEVPKVLEFRL